MGQILVLTGPRGRQAPRGPVCRGVAGAGGDRLLLGFSEISSNSYGEGKLQGQNGYAMIAYVKKEAVCQKERRIMEYCDVYDRRRRRTGRLHQRGTPLDRGDFMLVVCTWVSDGAGRLLLTKRAPEKQSYPNAWENSGGCALAGETSRQAIVRELWEETGIRAREEEFQLLETARTTDTFYDFYFLIRPTPLDEIVLQPGETSDVKWVTFAQMRQMIQAGEVAKPIARRFRLQEPQLLALAGE